MAEDNPISALAPQQFSVDVMLEKYAKGDESSVDDIYRRVARTMRDEAYRASVELARERGAFPLFDARRYLDLEEGTFASRLSDDLKNAIRMHGIRNSHLFSIAPTGTVSLHSPTTHRTVSSLRSRGPINAPSAWPMVAVKPLRSRTMRTGCIARWAVT